MNSLTKLTMTNRDVLIELLTAIADVDDKITKLEDLGVKLTVFDDQLFAMERAAMYLATGDANTPIPDIPFTNLITGTRTPAQVADELMVKK